MNWLDALKYAPNSIYRLCFIAVWLHYIVRNNIVNLVDPYIFIAVDSVTNQCILDLDSTLQNCTHPDTMSCQ